MLHLPPPLFWPHHTACGILATPLGSEPVAPALEAQRLNHWTTREVQCFPSLLSIHEDHGYAVLASDDSVQGQTLNLRHLSGKGSYRASLEV